MSETAQSAERLQKILARAGVASRRKVEEMILEGRVTVNGRIATLGDKADGARDSIKVDGKRVGAPVTHHYLVLNKPKGVMTTVEDPEGRPTVMELVPAKFRKALVPVGRLDFMTEGLLLLTSDGEFAQRLSHPRYGCRKTYLAKVSGEPREADLDKLRAGVVLDGRRTAPCRIEATHPPSGKREGENTWWNVDLTEGRTRQIREMFERIGHPVQKLRRVAIGSLRDPGLPVGALRELSAEEVERLLRATATVKPRRAPAPVLKRKSFGGERPAAKARPRAAGRPSLPRVLEGGQQGEQEKWPDRRPSRFAPRPPAGPRERRPEKPSFTAKRSEAAVERSPKARPFRRRDEGAEARGPARPRRGREEAGASRGPTRPPAPERAGGGRGAAGAGESGAPGRDFARGAGRRRGFARGSGAESRRGPARSPHGTQGPHSPGQPRGPRGPRDRRGPGPAGGPKNRGGGKSR
jgi:23S rRNA pseudouridine2605 synthase